MQDYGYYSKKNSAKSDRPSTLRILKIIDVVLLVITVVCSLLLVCALIARYVDPRKAYFFAFTGLIFPMLYVAELILCLWWVVRWKKYAIFAAIILLLGMRTAGGFYRPDFRRHYDDAATPVKSQFTVMSYNVMGFSNKFSTENMGTRQLIANLINDNNVDIVCFQEFTTAKTDPSINELLSDFRYYKTFPYAEEDEAKKSYSGLAIYSRYPILNSSLLASDGCERSFAAWADIKIKLDTVRVFAVHLNSTHIDSEDISYLIGLRHGDVDNDNRSHIFSMTGKLRNTYMKRAPQALAVAENIAQSPHPVIVCGDFNDTPASFAYHNVRKGLSDAFIKKGSGMDATYNGFLNMFRIDYIMFSKKLNVTQFLSFDEQFSDHTPIAASFDFAAH